MAPPSFVVGPGALRPSRHAASAAAPVRPRHWQRQLIQLLRARLAGAAPAGHDVLVHAGPGAGKTLGALLAFAALQREGRLDRFLVFCHRTAIASQWQQAAARLGLGLLPWDPGCRPDGHAWDGLLISYQSVGRSLVPLQRELPALGLGRWLAIADEVHHLGLDPEEPGAASWGPAFSGLTAAAPLRLGLTGTPFRADNLAFSAARRETVREGNTVLERIVPDLSVEPRQLIAAGDVRPLEFRFQDGWVDHGRPDRPGALHTSSLSQEARESWRARNLRRAIRLGDGSGIALQVLLRARHRLERLRAGHPGAGGLVVARDIAHARGISRLLAEQGDQVHLVHSQDAQAPARLAAFRAGEADWLVSVDMCAEGFDAPRLRVVAYLTTVVTRSRFLQAITRAVRIDAARAGLEGVPREASSVFAPADPLLIGHARSWALSEPYRIRPGPAPDSPGGGSGGAAAPPLEAVAARLGAVIRVGGPELPLFLAGRV